MAGNHASDHLSLAAASSFGRRQYPLRPHHPASGSHTQNAIVQPGANGDGAAAHVPPATVLPLRPTAFASLVRALAEFPVPVLSASKGYGKTEKTARTAKK
jgi:hypothetical protein